MKVEAREIRKAAKDCRRHLSAGLAFLDARDLTRAYAELEMAQHAAYEAKMMVDHGGTYEPQDLPAVVTEIRPGTPEWDESERALVEQRRQGG